VRVPFDEALRLVGGDEQALVTGERHQTITHWRNLGVPAHAILRTLLRAHRTAAQVRQVTDAVVRNAQNGRTPARARRASPSRLHVQLARLRKERGLSRRQLSEKVGIERPRIARIEAGAVDTLDLRMVARLAGALGARVTIVLEKSG
jgi:DNA-binding XRE family transcriptional regulator